MTDPLLSAVNQATTTQSGDASAGAGGRPAGAAPTQQQQQQQPDIDDELTSAITQAVTAYSKALPGDIAAAQQAKAAQAGYAANTAGLYRMLGSQPLPNIPTPKYKPLPTPPKAEYRDPIEAFGNPLAGLAMIAGIFTRRSGTTALRAGAAAMKAQREGDQQAYENSRNYFKDALDQTMKANDQEARQYQDAVNDYKLNWDAKLARVNALATANQNASVAAAARSGNSELLLQRINGLTKARDILKGLRNSVESDPVKAIWGDAYRAAEKEGKAKGYTGTELTEYTIKRATEMSAPAIERIEDRKSTRLNSSHRT